ncbi:MAG: DUF1015 family protein [Eubacteriales bacterium]|nr:DUF1015 family protein [Eubacteriales bacterium]
MAKITAFEGIRPRRDMTARVAALPYDVYSRQEAKAETLREPLSFLRIDRAETQLGDEVDTYAPEVYQKARDLLWDMVEKGELVKDTAPCYYVYELTMNGRSQTGLVACASVQDYLDGVIMKHENTREDKEQDRIRHVDICDAQTGPIFLAYRYHDVIAACMKEAKKTVPIFDFVSPDGVGHRGWMISDMQMIRTIQSAFEQISQIYIADGHHRAASAVKVGLKRRAEAEAAGKGDRELESDRFLSVLFAENELHIMDYNRVVRDLNGMTPAELLEKLMKVAEVRRYEADSGVCVRKSEDLTDDRKKKEWSNEDQQCHPQRKGQVGMYLDGSWYELTFKKEYCPNHPVDGLDVSILQDQILAPMLGIGDPRTDERIRFVGGIRGLKELERIVDMQHGVAFSMYPTSMQELFAVADAKLLMPPKSTWFEPKLRSGLFIHAIK